MRSIEQIAHEKVANFFDNLLARLMTTGKTTIDEGTAGLIEAYDNNEEMDQVYDRMKVPVMKGIIAGLRN